MTDKTEHLAHHNRGCQWVSYRPSSTPVVDIRWLIKRSVVDRLGCELNTRCTPPDLQGVTGSPLRFLGVAWLEIAVGDEKVSKQWLSVVPDSYLSSDLLLGCEVLGQEPLT